MNKLTKLLSVVLLSMPMASCITSCDDNPNSNTQEVEFNFDDKYFVGMQEHFYEIRTMERSVNTDFICDLNGAIGAKVFRINVTMNNLFYVDRNDTVKFNESVKDQFHTCIDKLIASGVERIIYANDSFIYPYGYSVTHSISCPDPYAEHEAYLRWLKVNATGYGMMAKEFPEVKYFEPINEPDMPTGEVLCKNGMLWGTSDPTYIYSETDEANIVADLCYYIRKEIKAVDENNMMMTPALTSLNTCKSYLNSMYLAIESGAHPIGDDDPCSVDPDDYFDIIDIHPYSFVQSNVNPVTPKEEGITLITDDYVAACNEFYQICCDHGDAEKPHWYTELGFTDSGSTAAAEVIGREVVKQLDLIKSKLPYVECVVFYKMCDMYEYSVSITEDHFGLAYAPNDVKHPDKLKPAIKAVYSWMHNGSQDYSAIQAVYEKYKDK